jgi:enoyl-CoA hydratase/carnithine racemase
MKYLRVDRPVPGVLRVRLDRPERRNAIDGAVLDELEAIFDQPAEPVAVLGSADPRAFCAGGDLTLAADALAAVSDRLFGFYEHLIGLPTVVVAAVGGPAFGAGAQLVLAADVRIGSPAARICFLGAGSGLALGTWRLPELVGSGRATELSLLGRSVTGAEAAAMGLLGHLVDDPDATAVALAGSIAQAPAGASAQVKRLTLGPDTVARLRAERAANAAHPLRPRPGPTG